MFGKVENVARAVVLLSLALFGAKCGAGYDQPLPADVVFRNLRDNVDERFPTFSPEQREMYLQIVGDLEVTFKDTPMSLREAELISESIGNTFMIDDLRPAGLPSQRRSRGIY